VGRMSDEKERFVPTPEELEEGALQRRRRKSADRGDEAVEEKPRPKFSLLRGRGVGRRRKYVKVDDVEASTRSAEATEAASAATEAPPATTQPTTGPQPVQGVQPQEAAQRVKSITVPARKPKAPRPKYEPYSKEAQFFQKATDKGHQMGDLVAAPNSTNLEAFCNRCEMRGELVVVREENYSNVTNHHFRGQAINRSCTSQHE
jgi:hypothetical protein